jgi:hypothetical protein
LKPAEVDWGKPAEFASIHFFFSQTYKLAQFKERHFAEEDIYF